MGDAARCPDCQVEPGQLHLDGCDVARCRLTGSQLLMCGERHACAPDVWTGDWPGAAECREFGWWALFAPPWRRVPAGTPGAVEDLNRLAVEAQWDVGAQRWVRRG